MSTLTYIQDRFCWEQDDFTEWDDYLPKQAVIMPYQGWTPPTVVGDGKNFWEIHPQDDSKDLGKSSLDGFILKTESVFTVKIGKIELEAQKSIAEAIAALQRWRGIGEPFIPKYSYRKPAGKLRQLLNDPASILVVLCGWKGYRREQYGFLPIPEAEKRKAGLLLGEDSRIMDEFLADQAQRTPESRFDYQEEIIPLRTEEYAPADYCYDSVVKVLPPDCCKNPAAVEYFKLKQLELAERRDLDAIFVKQGTQYFGLGCRHQDFLGEFDHFLLRQLTNYREILPLKSLEPLDALFEFLQKIKNNHYVLTHHASHEPPQKFIEEQLPRLPQKLGSMTRAMRYYSKVSPFLRSQWEKYTIAK